MIEDWHPADIIAAIKKKGTSLSALSRSSGLNSSTLSNALSRRWPKGERIIADFLELQPSQIWPSRYLNKKR
ncbi:helix-turn-helix domain-containing protein [Providencia burhodogranariea]|uniref:Putative DNA-binding protein n=1 Tax=Providencia burhodogranariea DSM 19968 TaxID=1141662 RepID=K8WVQ3_9GAMM|nr:helix-turn-helix transcriptional regulator [Providencia burhodogranariea]EKT60280.1 putative DNA-binding protein [Providencia burhodogranariea DSM 19968]